jgi:hypothetical protein
MKRFAFAVSFLTLFTHQAFPQDECKDVLVNKVMNELKVTKDTYYNTVVLSKLNQSSDQQSSTGVGLGVEIEGIPFSLNYSDARRIKANLSRYYSLNEIAQESWSYLLMSGQDVIVNAWRDCMTQKGGGMSVRFKPLDGKVGKQTLLLIEYIKPALPTTKALDLKLVDDVYIDPAMEVKTGAQCLKANRVFRPGDACTVLLITKDAPNIKPAWVTMPIVLIAETQGGEQPTTASYSAYLGPRAELVGSIQPWPAKGTYSTNRTYSFDSGVVSPVECFPSTDGYSLLENSLRIVARPEGGATYQTCTALPFGPKKENYIFDQSGKKLCVQQVNGTPSKADHYCQILLTGTEATVKWDPAPPVDPGEIKFIQSFSPAFAPQ